MVISYIDYCYAKQLLNENGLELYMGENRILKPVRNLYKTQAVRTTLIKGEMMIEKENIKQLSRYDEIKRRLGYIVVSIPVNNRERWFANQRVKYKLVKKSFPGDMGGIPPNHAVIMSTLYKRIRLVGPNASPTGYGPWIDLAPRRKSKTIIDNRYSYDYIIKNRKKVRNRMLGIEDYSDIEYIGVDELPVMFSNQGELVCIPIHKDEYVILVVGRRGTGKTYTTASISSRLYWHDNWRKKLIFLNDHHDQMHTWALPNLQAKSRNLLARLGNLPMPLPLVFLYPKTNTFFEDKVFAHGEVDISYLMSLPLFEMIQDYKNYLKGNKDWELKGGTAVLFRNMQEELLTCKTYDEVKSAVANYVLDEDDKKLKISPQSQAKIIATMDDIFSQQILDTSTEIPSVWTLHNKRTNQSEDLYSFVALLKAGIIPVIKTKDVITKFYYSQYMKFIIDTIFNNQTLNKWFLQNQVSIYIVVDEITDIASKQKLWDVGGMSLMNCATQGRPNRIGLLANTQDYTAIPDKIINQSEFCFALQLKDKEANKVGKDYELTSHQIEDIKNLEKFEMMALTKRHFVVYDKQGNRRETKPNEAIRGYSLPPLCQHMPPK